MEVSRRAIFPTLLVSFAVLYLWRMSGAASFEPIARHVSNLYLTGAALTLLSGPRAFVDARVSTRPLVAAAALVVLNLAFEVVLPVFGVDDEVNEAMGDVNTSDSIDAVFGIAAVLVVLALLPRRSPSHR